jgi:hypothetical protein
MWQTFHSFIVALQLIVLVRRPLASSISSVISLLDCLGSKYGRHLRFGYNCFPVTQLDAFEVYDRHRRIGVILVVKNVVRTGVCPDNSDGPKSINGG